MVEEELCSRAETYQVMAENGLGKQHRSTLWIPERERGRRASHRGAIFFIVLFWFPCQPLRVKMRPQYYQGSVSIASGSASTTVHKAPPGIRENTTGTPHERPCLHPSWREQSWGELCGSRHGAIAAVYGGSEGRPGSPLLWQPVSTQKSNSHQPDCADE